MKPSRRCPGSDQPTTAHPRRPAPRPPAARPPAQPPPPYTARPYLPDQIRLRIVFTHPTIPLLDFHVNPNITIRNLQHRIQAARPQAPAPTQYELIYRHQPIPDPAVTVRSILDHHHTPHCLDRDTVHVLHVHGLHTGTAVANDRDETRNNRQHGVDQHHYLHHQFNIEGVGIFLFGVLLGWTLKWLGGTSLRSSR